MKNYVLLLCLLFSSIDILAQNSRRLYYNKNWELTKTDSSYYIRDAELDLNRLSFEGKVYDYNKNGLLIMEGNFHANKRNGLFKFYYDNGNLESMGKYSNYERDSVWNYFYPDGNLKLVVNFDNNEFIVNEYRDEESKYIIKDGTGTWIYVYPRTYIVEIGSLNFLYDGYVKVKGKFKDYKKEGLWSWIHEDHSTQQKIKYKNGIPVENPLYRSQEFPDDKIEKLNKTCSFIVDTNVFKNEAKDYDVGRLFSLITNKEVKSKNIPARYIGGDYALFEFIASNIDFPEGLTNRIEEKILVKVTIDENGYTKNISTYNSNNEALNKEAQRVVKLIPKWLPAIKNGSPSEASIIIPVSFSKNK